MCLFIDRQTESTNRPIFSANSHEIILMEYSYPRRPPQSSISLILTGVHRYFYLLAGRRMSARQISDRRTADNRQATRLVKFPV